METSNAEMAGMYFKRIEGVSLSDQGVDIQMFNIVVILDGSRDVQTVAREEGYDLKDLLQKIFRLQELGLVEAVGGRSTYVGRQVMNQLVNNFSMAVGPIASIMIEDILADMGHTTHNLPGHKFTELIRRVREKITDKDLADEFIDKATALIP